MFDAYANKFLDGYFELAPVEATLAGEHRYDATWPDVSAAGDAKLARVLRRPDARAREDPARRARRAEPDRRARSSTIRCQLRPVRARSAQAARPDPVYYTDLIGEGLDPLVNRKFGTTRVAAREPARPARRHPRDRRGREAAPRARRRRSTPRPRSSRTRASSRSSRPSSPRGSPRASDGSSPRAAKRAAAALHDFQTFLEKDLLPRSDGSFRLGRERFEKKLALRARRRRRHRRDRRRRARAARADAGRDGRRPPSRSGRRQARQAADARHAGAAARRSSSRCSTSVAQGSPDERDDPRRRARRGSTKATAFVREQDLVRVPDEPVAVIEMPEYRRGVAVAYCDASGPLETKPETFYAISPTPTDWPQAARRVVLPRVQPGMLADLTDPRGDARPLPAAHAQQPVPVEAPRRVLERPVRRGLGGLQRVADGRARLRRPKVQASAPEDGAAARRQRDPRSRHPRRRRWTRRPRSR